MYTEKVKFKAKSSLRLFLRICGYAFGLLALSWVFNAVQILTGYGWVGIFPYLIAGVMIWHIFRKYIVEYHYALGDGRLYIYRSYGRRETLLVDVPLKKIISFGPWNGEGKITPYLALRPSNDLRLLKYIDKDKKEKQLVFAPGEKYLLRLQTAIDNLSRPKKASAAPVSAGEDDGASDDK